MHQGLQTSQFLAGATSSKGWISEKLQCRQFHFSAFGMRVGALHISQGAPFSISVKP
jgi:hypothetical protein